MGRVFPGGTRVLSGTWGSGGSGEVCDEEWGAAGEMAGGDWKPDGLD